MFNSRHQTSLGAETISQVVEKENDGEIQNDVPSGTAEATRNINPRERKGGCRERARIHRV